MSWGRTEALVRNQGFTGRELACAEVGDVVDLGGFRGAPKFNPSRSWLGVCGGGRRGEARGSVRRCVVQHVYSWRGTRRGTVGRWRCVVHLVSNGGGKCVS